MFAKALETASSYTRPVVISTRTIDGTVKAVFATYIILNSDGWIITAGHIYDTLAKMDNDRKKIAEIETFNATHPENEHKAINGGWLVDHSFWWGFDGAVLKDVSINREQDILIGRLVIRQDSVVNGRKITSEIPLPALRKDVVKSYPVFRDPNSLRVGTSLVRTGFAFCKADPQYDYEKKGFRLSNLEISLFPNECMHTRNVVKKNMLQQESFFIETSTPGIKGQSGGPILDRDGNLYAMQVQTASFDMNLHACCTIDDKNVTEAQFLNLGLAVPTGMLMRALDERKIKYLKMSECDGFRIID